MAQDLADDTSALVQLSGNNPLPEPMLTQFYVAIWHRQATMSGYILSNIYLLGNAKCVNESGP